MTTFDDTTTAGEQRIRQLEEEVARLAALVEQLTQPSHSAPRAETTTDVPTEPEVEAEVEPEVEHTSSRRGLLRLAGAAAAGAVASTVVGVGQAAADDGLVINAGAATDTPNLTRVLYTGNATTSSAFVFSNNLTSNFSLNPAALAAFGSTVRQPNGVYGFTNSGSGAGVVGRNSGTGGDGVYGLGDTGVRGESTTAAGNGVEGDAQNGSGVFGTSETFFGVWGISSGDGISSSGVTGSGAYGLSAFLNDRANLYLAPNNDFLFTAGPKTPPRQRADEHVVGEIDNVDGDIWLCVGAGTPGTWLKIAGPATAGAFHPIATARVYDSRRATGAITVGANRLIDVKDKRDPGTYAVTQANAIPVGATAVAYNVTVTEFTLRGNLAVEPGNASAAGGSTINWSPGPFSLANASVAKLDSNRSLKVFAGGQVGGTTQFIIDVVGYYT